MSLARTVLLRASQSRWLRERAPRYSFVRRNVARFMPGETSADALAAVRGLAAKNIGAVLTALGENVTDRAEAAHETQLYRDLLQEISAQSLTAEISVKLTHLGLDLDENFCFDNLLSLISATPPGRTTWIDMEQSPYVDRTLEIYRRARHAGHNVGVCLQAYLRRTEKDLGELLPLGGAIRLVKGAYNEPASVAFPRKSDVDVNYFKLTQLMLSSKARHAHLRAAIATHDRKLIQKILDWGQQEGIPKEQLEFQMLYGIQRAEQLRLASLGCKSVVLVAFGSFWFPWYMRRLAERPANLFFLLRNFFSD
jgi:proline dehydrogenase